MMTISSRILVSVISPLRVVAGSMDDERRLLDHDWLAGLVKSLAVARRELHMLDLAKPEGFKLILTFPEKKEYKKDALGKALFADCGCGTISRGPGQTLPDFFATLNMAYADAVKAGVGIDPDRRAHHMFNGSGLTCDQINHIYGFVCDPDAVGPSAAILGRFKELRSDFTTNPGMWTP